MAMSKENISQFQDVIRCDLCIEAAAKLHCDTCQVYVCHACVGTHITTDTSKQHLVVECKKRSKIKLTECKSHSAQRCDLQCRQCNVPVCSKCMASTHAHHTVIDILDFCKSKEEEIRRENHKIESIKVSELERAKLKLIEQIVNLPKLYTKAKESITQLGKEWHKEIDVIIGALTNKVDTMITTDLKKLQGQQQKLDETMSLADEILLENTTILKSTDASAFDMYRSRVEKLADVPLDFYVQAPEFIPMEFDKEKIENCFGSLIHSSVRVNKKYGTLNKKKKKSNARKVAEFGFENQTSDL